MPNDESANSKRGETQNPGNLSNHPGSQERQRERKNEPHEGQDSRFDPGEDSENLQTPEEAREGKGDTRDNGYRRNYGGFDREAAGTVGDRRSLNDWDPEKREETEDS